jgi:hypothetical protein
MAPLLKSGTDLLEQGLDLARRREFDRAREKFADAGAKLAKEGRPLESNLARAYAELMMYPAQGRNPTYLANLAAFLQRSVGGADLRPGPRSIPALELAGQLNAAATEAQLIAQVGSGGGDRAALATALQGVAMTYRQMGGQILFLPDLFDHQVIAAGSKFSALMAVSFEVLGQSERASNPLAAAEHFQTARQYWAQAGDAARAEAAAAESQHLGLRARCWFCGREGIGHGVQFVSMPIDQDVSRLKGEETSPLPSLDGSGRQLFACQGCSSAVRLLADALAAQRSREVEARLLVQIRALEARMRSMAMHS